MSNFESVEQVLEKLSKEHYIAVSRARTGEPVNYWVGAGWTASGDFRDVRDWVAYLDQWSQRLAAPIKTTIGSAKP